VETKAGEQNDE